MISTALVFCLLLGFLPAMQVSASGPVQVRVADISDAQRDEIINVNIYLDGNPGLLALGLALEIDTTVFERQPSTAAAVAAPGPFVLGALSTPAQQPSVIHLGLEGPYLASNTYYTGRIATIPLRVRDDAPLGSLATALTLVSHAGGPLCAAFTVPPMTITQGTVNVTAAPLLPANVRVVASPMNATRGDIIDVHIYLDDNPGLLAIGLSVTIDPAVLQRQASTAVEVAAPGPFVLGALSTPAQQPITVPLGFEGPYLVSNTYYTGRIATIPFLVLTDAPLGSSAITLAAHAGGGLNSSFDIVPLGFMQGSVTVAAAPVPTLILTPASVTVNDAVLSVSSAVSGTATGAVTLGAYTLPAGVIANVSGTTVTITGIRPPHTAAADISGTFTIPVIRDGITEILTVVIDLTRLADPGDNGGGNGGGGNGGGNGGGGNGGGGGGTTVQLPEERPPTADVGQFFTSYHNAFLVGFPDGTVRPNSNISRAEVTTILFRLLNDEFRASVWSQQNGFTDIRSDAWFNNAISTMANAGIIGGSNGAFRPNDAVTRAEFAAMIARFFSEFSATDNAFSDIEGNWAENYINLVAQFGWVQGAGDGTFNPNALMTRAEVAAIVNRMLDRVIDSTDELLPGRTRFPDKTNMNAWYYLYMQEATHSTEFERFENGNVSWTRILPVLDWTVLERPISTPGAIVAARDIQQQATAD